jgi:two-component system nitrogen regulation sensor histidine kinase NtrY
MEVSAGRRKSAIIVLGSVLLVLLLGFTALNAFKLDFLNPSTTGGIIVFTGLSVVAFLLFMAGLVLLVRNVLKLYADQRNSVMGTRLRTRMVGGAVLVSLIPLVFMFLYSYGLMAGPPQRGGGFAGCRRRCHRSHSSST